MHTLCFSCTEFCAMTVDELTEYISDTDLEVPSADAVFDAVLTWTHFDAETR